MAKLDLSQGAKNSKDKSGAKSRAGAKRQAEAAAHAGGKQKTRHQEAKRQGASHSHATNKRQEADKNAAAPRTKADASGEQECISRVIVVGSPRSTGRCASLANLLFEACIADYPEDEVALVPVSELDIRPCVGCNGCRDSHHTCVINDDMQDVYPLIEDADELIFVAPVYFAGPSASFKCFLDRLQPYFWTNVRHSETLRPATLHVIGEGHDPFGFEPLVTCTRSAAFTAGFRLESVLSWVGCMTPEGDIESEASEYMVLPLDSAVPATPACLQLLADEK